MFEKERDKYLNRHGFEGMHLKAVLFDMDGVLFDSMKNHSEAWHIAMTKMGFHFPKSEAYMHEGRTGSSRCNRRRKGADLQNKVRYFQLST